MPQEWTIQATVSDRDISWSYDDGRDAHRAWRHMEKTHTTIDSHDHISSANIRCRNGDRFYLGERVPNRSFGRL